MGSIRYALNLAVAFADYKFKFLGRKVIHNTALVLMCAAATTLFLVNVFEMAIEWHQLVRVCVLAILALTSQVFIVNTICASELFPTPIRNIGNSFIQLCNRIGVALAPQVFYLSETWPGLPYLIIMVFMCIDFLGFQIFIPETKGRPLTDHFPAPHERIFYKGRGPPTETAMEPLTKKEPEEVNH